MEEGSSIIGRGNSLDYSKANCNPHRHNNVNSHNSMSIETDVWQNGIVARLPESPRRLNTHWSEKKHLSTWSENHLKTNWSEIHLKTAWSSNRPSYQQLISWNRPAEHCQKLPKLPLRLWPARWLFVTISRSQLNQIPQRLWLLKKLSRLW